MKREEYHSLTIRNATVIDPHTQTSSQKDLFVSDGLLVDKAEDGAPSFDAAGCYVCPGLMDIHVHLREPGFEHKETIESGSRAAAAGGFTRVACMPNTKPPIDTAETIRLVLERAKDAGYCDVLPIGTITVGREGKKITDFAALLSAGAVAFSDDGDGVDDDDVMRLAFEEASRVGATLLQHCEYKKISAGGVMHLGNISKELGLPGIDPLSEEKMIERDIELCRQTGARYHITHVSTARAVDLVRSAKSRHLPITAEVCTHHLLLTHEACRSQDPNTKMHPPLRTQEDVDACRMGLVDGTIDCIVTDHAPHTEQEKDAGFVEAPPGIVGLDIALPLAIKAMVQSGLSDYEKLVSWLTTGPAKVLGLAVPTFAPGSRANLTIIDPVAQWTIKSESFESKGSNTPFIGLKVEGRAIATLRGTTLVTNTGTLCPAN